MIATPHYGAFNARWLSFEDVARTFVPVPQYKQLAHESHSVLLGPRGCGKTTLLKMLTRRALDEWDATVRAGRFQTSFLRPRYEAVYISSDVRWSYELADLPQTAGLSPALSCQAQRVMVSANALFHLLEATEGLVAGKQDVEARICECLIERWHLSGTLRIIADVRASLDDLVSEIRGYLNIGNSELERIFDVIPASFYGHTLDAPLDAISLISDRLPNGARPGRWALCYDELEIAPSWLRIELLEALRSVRQNVLLKLTWSPLLPSGLRTSPESAGDFKAIRLWHSHITDPRSFCEELTQDFLRERFPGESVTPDAFFSRSILASERSDEPLESYERGSTEYEVFKELASWDQSFRRLLQERNIDPNNPVPKSLTEKDQFFRKVKPIALLRREFTSELRDRSRKAVTVYAGKEAVYAMSEGNPRWLRGLLNDFADLGVGDGNPESGRRIAYSEQAKILNTAGQRFLALIKASPFKPPSSSKGDSRRAEPTLFEFVNAVGLFFRGAIYDREFPLDPVGSFEVPENTDAVILALIEQLMELGAVVYIGSSPQDIPSSITKSRFRLSFILAPIHKLALRTYRSAKLDDVLSEPQNPNQMQMEFLA